MSFKIITDSSSNLPAEYVIKHNIPELAFSFSFNGGDHKIINTDSFDGPSFYNMMRSGTSVVTSQVNPQAYLDAFSEVLASGQDVLYISMSSGISGSYNSSCIAVEELRDQYPDRKIISLNTRAASLGEGLIVHKAIELQEKGMELDQIMPVLEDMCDCMYQVFTVDDLKYLRKTGRISNATAIVGTVLNIKPLLKGNENGQIVTFDKVRGRKKSIEALAKKYDEVVYNASEQTIGIAHADCAEDAELLISLLNKNNPPKEIITVMYEPVTGSHVGPGTLALFFCGDKDARFK